MGTTECIQLIAACGAIVAMLAGLWLIHARLKAKNQGFGPNSLKAIGVVLLVPTLLLIAIVLPDFQSETLAALLGTVAGYVLSHSRPDE